MTTDSLTNLLSHKEAENIQLKNNIGEKLTEINKLNLHVGYISDSLSNVLNQKEAENIQLNNDIEEKLTEINELKHQLEYKSDTIIDLANNLNKIMDSLKNLNEILNSTNDCINAKDLMKWNITYFEGVVDYFDYYDNLNELHVTLKNGNSISFFTKGFDWEEIKDKNPPYYYNFNDCNIFLEEGCRIRGYYGKGYHAGYESPDGSFWPPDIVNRLVYVEDY